VGVEMGLQDWMGRVEETERGATWKPSKKIKSCLNKLLGMLLCGVYVTSFLHLLRKPSSNICILGLGV
jgi:hypothetical protein